ncbi:haloacid dehalogenase-like hydrolase domain-containing protein 3 [Tubulanus polymorphus]|uniref:haloacid dehalogenase-like hydrolase domain-containing protein 3 n=1 Tax=Tubulanus polymorphus TaxID=672921 RepID=UPI003DA35C74
MNHLKLITFDVTNTILKFRDVGRIYSNAARLFGIQVSADAVRSSFRDVWLTQEKLYPNFGVGRGMTPKQWWRDVVSACLLKNASVDIDEQKMKDIADYLYQRYMDECCWDLLPYSRETLDNLRRNYKHLRFGVISNFDERLFDIFETMDLMRYFDFVIISTQANCYKPDPEIFRMALSKVGVAAHEALHIGDHIVKDYLGALNVGMNAFLLTQRDLSGDNRVNTKHVLKDIRNIEQNISALGLHKKFVCSE